MDKWEFISEMKQVTEVGRIFQAEGTYEQRLREKFSKEKIQNNNNGHCHWSRLSTWKNAAIQWPKLIWKQYPEGHDFLSKIHKAMIS